MKQLIGITSRSSDSSQCFLSRCASLYFSRIKSTMEIEYMVQARNIIAETKRTLQLMLLWFYCAAVMTSFAILCFCFLFGEAQLHDENQLFSESVSTCLCLFSFFIFFWRSWSLASKAVAALVPPSDIQKQAVEHTRARGST